MNIHQLLTRLDELRRRKQLAALLPKRPDGRMPWASWLSALWYLGFLAAGVALAVAAINSKQPDVVRAQVTVAVVLGLLGLLARGLAFVAVPREERIRNRLCRSGSLVPGAMLQANNRFFDDDNQEPLPGNLLISFDHRALERPERLTAVAASVARLKGADRRTLPAPLAAIAWDLYHELGPTLTLPLPPEHADGLLHTFVISALLPPRPERLGDVFAVLALRGDLSWHAAAVLPAG
jgi:hypothetical protein